MRHRGSAFVGFVNPGTNTCFVNSVLQVLYGPHRFHSQAFKEALLDFECPDTSPDCIVCAVRQVFEQYVERPTRPIDGRALQTSLAELPNSDFKNREQGDAMEALHLILQSVHCAQVGDSSLAASAQSCGETCPSHIAFNAQFSEELQCQCGAQSAAIPWDYSTFSQPFYVGPVLESGSIESYKFLNLDYPYLLRHKACSSILPLIGSMAEFLQVPVEVPGVCSANCSQPKIWRTVTLSTEPQLWCLNLIWKEPFTSLTEALKLFAMLPDTFSLDKVYPAAASKVYVLKALLVYGYGHYICYIYDSYHWQCLDDYEIQRMGPKYEVIVDCLNRGMAPVGAMYEAQGVHSQPLPLRDWLALEKWALEIDMELMEDTPADDLTTNDSLTRDVKEHSDTWTCGCGTKHIMTHLVCAQCNQTQKGTDGWACPHCTYFNSTTDNRCEICNTQCQMEFWVCYCGEEKNFADTCRKCNRDKSQLQICGGCGGALESEKFCSACNAPIRTEGYCIRCIQKGRWVLCVPCAQENCPKVLPKYRCEFCPHSALRR